MNPVRVEAPLAGPPAPVERIADYRIILQSCVREQKPAVLAIRAMRVEGADLMLTVDPRTLETRLERAACWTCGPPGPEAWSSRYLKAVDAFARKTGDRTPPGATWLDNAGLTHGRGGGVFVTGDLCPSQKPLDRDFFLRAEIDRMPVALSVSGAWVAHHAEDFLWLRREKAAGRLDIVWVNHSWRHPFRRGALAGETFLLTPDIDPKAEIFDVERLLIANGETPSVFFRYPGLISNAPWVERLRAALLIPLGADAWLALGRKPTPGGVILVHPNGNEPEGLARFDRLNQAGALKSFRDLKEAP